MNSIGIACIDTKYHDATARAALRTIEILAHKANVARVYWLSDRAFPMACPLPVSWIRIKKLDGSDWVAHLNAHSLVTCPNVIDTEFALNVHHDGFACNSDAWTDEFLEYDYIGATWPFYDSHMVGNGGFSLRSRRLFTALRQIGYDRVPRYREFTNHICYEQDIPRVPDIENAIIPEDALICRYYRDLLEKDHGIKFAPVDLADRFSIEGNRASPWLGRSVGFHGMSGIHTFYGIDQL